jgi:hypothetical protein
MEHIQEFLTKHGTHTIDLLSMVPECSMDVFEPIEKKDSDSDS